MSKESPSHPNVTLAADFEPEVSLETGPDGLPVLVDLPGQFSLYAVIDGQPFRIGRYKAGKLLQTIAAAKAAAPAAAEPAATTPAP